MIPKSYLIRAAMICGLLPLGTGVGIFLVWLIVRWDSLMFAGAVTIYGGVVFVLVGLGLLIAYVLKRPAGERKSSVVALGVLLVNFPVAGLIMVEAIAIETRFTVTVVNNGPAPLDAFVVSGGGVEFNFGSVAPGQTATLHRLIDQDGELVFHARREGKEIDGQVEGYVTGSVGGHKRVVFDKAGKFEVLDVERK